MNAIILAGGFGTRLRDVVKDIPKPMAPVAGKPFLAWVLEYCASQGITQAILAVGYLHERIQDYFGEEYSGIQLKYSVENEPMGTGGGISKAMGMLEASAPAFVLNGDTMFKVDLKVMMDSFTENINGVLLALKPMTDFERYGAVLLDDDQRIVSFLEKKYTPEGLINGGVYLLCPKTLDIPELLSLNKGKFSFETDFLSQTSFGIEKKGFISNGYFIDIGIPEDYSKAQIDFTNF